jgi:tetratricopeptide (TPR) repeat protein/DNA-binding XRE family transcriptional regulator
MRLDGALARAAGDVEPWPGGLAGQVRDRRRAAGLTQLDLAAAAGVSIGVIRDLEQGRTGQPRRRSAERIAAALGQAGGQVGRQAARGEEQRVVPRQLPAAAPHFAGRTRELGALNGMLGAAGDDGAAAVSVTGAAGVGKTTLAVHWAHRVAAQFPDGQLYVNLQGHGAAANPVSPAEALRGFLDALAVPAPALPVGQESLAGLYRGLLSGKRVLVVLDNARDAAQVRPLLPGAGGCAAVITSRGQLTGLGASAAVRPLTLEVLGDDEARALLARRLGARRLAQEPAAAAGLAGLCARLPLALAITAAGAAARPAVPLGELASGIEDALAKPGMPKTGEAAVRAAFSLSYRNLSPGTSRMFRLLALHPGPDISAPAAGSLAGVGLRQTRRLLRGLISEGLLAEQVPGRFAFHDLIRGYAAELARTAENENERAAAAHRVLDHYLHTACAAAAVSQVHAEPVAPRPPRPGSAAAQFTGEDSALVWFRAENQTLRAAVAQALVDGFDTHAWQLTCTLAPFTHRLGQWHQHEWSALLATALAAAQRQNDTLGQALVHGKLGLISTRLGRCDDALSHLSLALGMHRRLGSQAGQAWTHLGLALMFYRQADAEEAVRHAEQALNLYRACGHRVGLAKALNAAGWYRAELGNHDRTLSYCRQALDLHRELGSRSGEATTLASIGYAQHHLGRYPQAIACYRSALGQLSGLADLDAEARVLTHLGDTQRAAGDPAAASDAWREALAILDGIHDPGANEVRGRLRGLDP